jgi:hypothetical protein
MRDDLLNDGWPERSPAVMQAIILMRISEYPCM